MNEETLETITLLIGDLKKQGIPALFIATEKQNFITVKNCSLETVSQLIVNQIEVSDEMKEAFVKELETITRKELEENE